jgi:RNA polymerase sigma factor (TIGR02999 family)
MRRILVERARRRNRIKHGGGRKRVDLDDANVVAEAESVDLVALDEVLRRLEKEEPRVARVVMMRFYAGLSEADAAEALDISVRTVWRDWNYAKAWLRDAMVEKDQ